MDNSIFILVFKSHDGKFKLTRAFENKNLLDYYADEHKIKFSWDIELSSAGYYVYEVQKD